MSGNLRKKIKESWYYYDGLGYGSVDKGHLTKEVNWLDTSDPNPLTPPDELLNQVITKEYDIFGNVVAVTDPRGNRTTTEFDAIYYTFPVKITNALGQVETGEYDPGTGQPLAKVDVNGNQTLYTYDVFGRLVKETGPDDLNSTYGTYTLYYQNYGNPASQHILTYRTENSGTADYLWSKDYFDGYGRVYKTETESAGGKSVIVDTVYDHRGRERQKSNQYFSGEAPRWTVFDYDALSRPVKASYPDGTSTSTSYAGLVVTATDRNGNQKVLTKDAYGRTVGQKDPYGREFHYTYDVVGHLIKWTDPNGNAFVFNYDSLGRQILTDNPVTGRWTYQYDLAGNLTSRTDANGNTVLYGYDTLNRPTKKDYPAGVDVAYVYDEAAYPNGIGRLTRVIDGSGQKEYFYDKKGRQVKVVQTVDGVGYTTELAYNAMDKVTRLTYPDGFVINYSYDAGNNLYQIAAGTSTYATIPSYNAHRQPLAVNYGNGIGAQYTYDPNNWWLKTLNAKNGSLQNFSYQYDNAGNVTGITDNAPVSTFHLVAETQSFTYDKLDQVATANGPYGNLTYTYDAAGNFLTKEGITYTYDLTRPYAVIGRSDGFQASYDGNGNMVTRNDFAYQYDYENRLTGISKAGVEVARYVYDADGQRVKAVTPSGTTLYIGELYEVAGATVRKHIRANGKLVATLESSGATTNTYYYHPNHIGSTNVVTDAAGNEVQRIEYLPFGKTRVEAGVSRTQYKFTGKELDEETSLYYFGARYYDPELGRFITSDPIQSGVNWYVYTANNPLRYVDPWGLRLAVTGSMNEEERDPDGQHIWSGDMRYDSQHALANQVHEVKKAETLKKPMIC